MRASRPEGFTAYGGISSWQFPYGMTLDEILRAGTAPPQEEKTPKRGIAQRARKPVRALVMQPNTRPKYSKYPEGKANLKMSDFDEEDEIKYDLEERPPCRQNSNLFDLEDNLYPVPFMQKFNGFIKDSGRGGRGEVRPPSRHKTPPKAVGLELPPKRVVPDFPEFLLSKDSPISDLENDSLSNTMPINFADIEKNRKKSTNNESAEIKHRSKPKSAKGKASEKVSVRMWSAASKPTKKKVNDVPIIINKKENTGSAFAKSRREKSKFEEEKADYDDKRKPYFKTNIEKRAQSSSNKSKLNMMLPFQSSLEPEFLNLFAKGEEFNF